MIEEFHPRLFVEMHLMVNPGIVKIIPDHSTLHGYKYRQAAKMPSGVLVFYFHHAALHDGA